MSVRSKAVHVAQALALALVLAGCLGRPGPVEEYLRVTGQPADCSQAAPGKARVAVAVARIKSAEALDRQAVMLATGRVMSPSLRWFWEASPGRLFEQAVVGSLNCSEGLAAVWPVRSTTETPLSLTGTVTGFEVRQSSMKLEAVVDCQVWDGEGARMLASRSFTAEAPVAALDGQSIAEAGAKALASLGGETAAWVGTVAGSQRGQNGQNVRGGGK